MMLISSKWVMHEDSFSRIGTIFHQLKNFVTSTPLQLGRTANALGNKGYAQANAYFVCGIADLLGSFAGTCKAGVAALLRRRGPYWRNRADTHRGRRVGGYCGLTIPIVARQPNHAQRGGLSFTFSTLPPLKEIRTASYKGELYPVG